MESSMAHTDDQQRGTLFSEGADYLPALPDLTPLYQRIVGSDICFGKRANGIIEHVVSSHVSIALGHFFHEEITTRIRDGINIGAFKTKDVRALLKKADRTQDVYALLGEISTSICEHVTKPIVDALEPCKTSLTQLGYDFSNLQVGDISIRDSNSSEICFNIDDVIALWRFDLGKINGDIVETFVSCVRSFANLASACTVAHETQDWELYYVVDGLPKRKFKALLDVDFEQDSCAVLKHLKKIIGAKAYADFVSTFEDYYDAENEEELVTRFNRLIDEVQFDRLPLFDRKLEYSATQFSLLKRRIKRTLASLPDGKDTVLLASLLQLVEAVTPFLCTESHELELAGDINLYAQCFVYFEGLDDVLSEQRIDSIADHLMQTGDMAIPIIDTTDPISIATFNNIQIGHMLLWAVSQALGDYYA
jgi:hypothetical protein